MSRGYHVNHSSFEEHGHVESMKLYGRGVTVFNDPVSQHDYVYGCLDGLTGSDELIAESLGDFDWIARKIVWPRFHLLCRLGFVIAVALVPPHHLGADIGMHILLGAFGGILVAWELCALAAQYLLTSNKKLKEMCWFCQTSEPLPFVDGTLKQNTFVEADIRYCARLRQMGVSNEDAMIAEATVNARGKLNVMFFNKTWRLNHLSQKGNWILALLRGMAVVLMCISRWEDASAWTSDVGNMHKHWALCFQIWFGTWITEFLWSGVFVNCLCNGGRLACWNCCFCDSYG